jgi:hypothetical protein
MNNEAEQKQRGEGTEELSVPVDILKQKMEYRRKQQIQFIVSQTNYDECEALQKLELCNNDVMKVVSDYLGITPKEDQNLKKTKNQKVYSVIRDIMDKGSNNHRMQQEKAKKIEQINELLLKRKHAHDAHAATSNLNKKEHEQEQELVCKDKDKDKDVENCNNCNNCNCNDYDNCMKNKNMIIKEKID